MVHGAEAVIGLEQQQKLAGHTPEQGTDLFAHALGLRPQLLPVLL